MQFVTLQFKGTQKLSPETMAGHNQWLEQGFADQVFLLSGSLDAGRGGCILADAESPEALQRRLEQDPLVAEGQVTVEICAFTPGRSRLDLDGLEAL